MSKEFSRREFLKLAVLTTAATLVESCAKPSPTTTLEPLPTLTPVEYQTAPITQEDLKKAILDLPEGAYKEFITGRAGFLTQIPYPPSLSFDQMTVPLFAPQIINGLLIENLEDDIISFTGAGTIHGNPQTKVLIEKDMSFFLPQPFIYEKEDMEKGIIVNIHTGQNFNQGIVPEISLYQPSYSKGNPLVIEFLADLKKFILVKEIASLAFVMGYIGHVFDELQKNNTDFYYTSPNNEKFEMVTPAVRSALRSNGRLLWTVDCAGLLLATKALEADREVSSSVYQYPDYKEFISKIIAQDFVANGEISRNLTNFCLDPANRSELKKWNIAGDPDKLKID